MKTFYIILILLLTASFANAQSNDVSVETKTNNTVSVSEVNDEVTTTVNSVNVETENEAILIDTEKVKESIARGTSDIRTFLNREKNMNNINLLFPNMNKAKSA